MLLLVRRGQHGLSSRLTRSNAAGWSLTILETEVEGLMVDLHLNHGQNTGMGSRTIVTLFDDFDGTTEGVRTVSVSLDGQTVEVDLSEANYDKVREFLTPYLEVGRKVRPSSGGSRRRPASAGVVVKKLRGNNSDTASARFGVPAARLAQAPVEDIAPSTQLHPVREAGDESAGLKYTGDMSYVGSEPPPGFAVKGAEQTMTYYLPESVGYSSTTAEVWFTSKEAAEQAGFSPADS